MTRCMCLASRSHARHHLDGDYASRQPEHYWDHAFFTSTVDPNRLVLTHDAKVYREGKTAVVSRTSFALSTNSRRHHPKMEKAHRTSSPEPS